MNETPAGRIRKEGFTFHGLRASSCEKLAEAGCNDKGDREYHWHVPGNDPALLTLREPEAPCQVRDASPRTAREQPSEQIEATLQNIGKTAKRM